jgi:hypothetical protein
MADPTSVDHGDAGSPDFSTAAATGVVRTVVSIAVMAQALLLVALVLRARHTGRPSPLAPLHLSGARPERSLADAG